MRTTKSKSRNQKSHGKRPNPIDPSIRKLADDFAAVKAKLTDALDERDRLRLERVELGRIVEEHRQLVAEQNKVINVLRGDGLLNDATAGLSFSALVLKFIKG